ncbi:ferritin-like domain-containing protein [Natrarchaeobius oligotrophus]|uniref:Ferritin-like domain-containing protein n=1 Tax=Natrarchaeobius chitinivorans TaxID=1679083 RepID=A0A3N6PPV8_NATCH|nr:ferritin-like domain-containing protein [Natrarchaeobius chitinivorans]RQH01256.1 ferritin-like domain-containing protein [Natrarchaeobius chitinivorans]
MSLETIHDLFEHGLEDIYHAEHELLDALDDLEQHTEREEIATAFADHREETRDQIDRLEEVFDMFGEPPEKEECEGIEGLIREYEGFTSEEPDQEVLDYHNMAAAEKTEHYEIAAYGNLIPLADQLGMSDAADLLEENLREEQDALERLKELTEEFEIEAIPAE